MSNLQKALTHGLMHGLKILRPDGKTVLEVYGYTPKNNILHFRENEIETFGCAIKSKPFLFPMSALTKEIDQLFPENETETYRIESSSSHICITGID